MRRIGNLYEKICSMETLERAYRESRKGKTKKKLVKMVDENPEFYLKQIQDMLINKTYKTSKYRVFMLRERGKNREVCDLPFFPDRIVHWAIMIHIKPIFSRLFIQDTYAAIDGKGTHLALRKLRKFMKDEEGTKYCLKLDVRKYFNNIDKEVLKQMLRRYIKCQDTLWLLDEIIDSYPQGIPIGNYTSQYFGNFYLSEFDHWIKEVKHRKYYLRYMDDLIIFGKTKQELHELREDIAEYLKNLGLELKKNWQVFPTKIRGVDYVGYRSFYGYTLLRKATKKRMKKATRVIQRRVDCKQDLTSKNLGAYASYNGILKHCSSFRLRNNSLKIIQKYVEKEIKKCRNTKKSTEHKQTDQKKSK